MTPEKEIDKGKVGYFVRDGILYRKWSPKNATSDFQTKIQYRAEILRVAHDVPMAGYLGIGKTQQRILHY